MPDNVVLFKIEQKPVIFQVSGGRGARGKRGFAAKQDFGVQFGGTMTPGERLGGLLSGDATFLEEWCHATVQDVVLADWTVPVEKNFVQVGSFTFLAGTRRAVWSLTGGQIVCVDEDEVDVVIPSTVDGAARYLKVTFGSGPPE